MVFGERVRQRRKALGMRVGELSKRSGVPVSTIYDIENGNIKSTTKLHELAIALDNCSMLWLRTGKGNPGDGNQQPLRVADVAPSFTAWPFQFDPERWHRLLPAQQEQVERLVLTLIRDFEAGGKAPTRGRRTTPHRK